MSDNAKSACMVLKLIEKGQCDKGKRTHVRLNSVSDQRNMNTC